jgi:Reeler domain
MFQRVWNVVTVVTLLFTFSSWTTEAYSSGAGQCIGGTAAVGAAHMTSTAVTGSLQDGAYSVTIGDQTSSPAPEITVNTDTSITIGISSSAPQFRGALIRASSSDGVTFTLEPGVNGANAMACPEDGVLGVTHSSNDLKSEFSGTLNAAAAGTITLDITVVRSQNSVDGSYYYYTPITVTVVDGEPEIDAGATLAPAASTTKTTLAPATIQFLISMLCLTLLTSMVKRFRASCKTGKGWWPWGASFRLWNCTGRRTGSRSKGTIHSGRAHNGVGASKLDPQGALGHAQATLGQ